MPDPQAETGKPKVTYGDVVDLKGQAEAQWEAVEKLNSGQGFSEYQKQCKGIFNAAQDCFEKKEYDLAKERFEKVTNACARLLALDQQREKAKQVREQAENERETAQEQGAEKDARVLWTDAGGLMEKAAKEFKGGKFSAAQTNWTAAAQKYTEARDKAQKEAAARKAAEEAARKKITAGRNARIDDLQMDLIWVEKGNFEMGSENGDSDEKPVRWVTLTKGYWMGKTEVSNGQYQRFLRESGYDGSGDADSDYLRHFEGHSEQPTGDEYPIIWVSWKNADEFCKWLTQRERDAGRLPDGYVYRLPTEAEWEFAARGGTKSRGYQYSGGNDLDAVGWYDKNGGGKTHPVGGKKANELGLHDMSGNVWEWCWDWYAAYNWQEVTDPKGPASGSCRVGRGGGWNDDAADCRVAYRNYFDPPRPSYYLGFRVVLAAPVQ